MSETKKEGFFKRLFGKNKGSCCGVKIEEIKEDVNAEQTNPVPPSGCCTPENETPK